MPSEPPDICKNIEETTLRIAYRTKLLYQKDDNITNSWVERLLYSRRNKNSWSWLTIDEGGNIGDYWNLQHIPKLTGLLRWTYCFAIVSEFHLTIYTFNSGKWNSEAVFNSNICQETATGFMCSYIIFLFVVQHPPITEAFYWGETS
jgi:hypothetical protein